MFAAGPQRNNGNLCADLYQPCRWLWCASASGAFYLSIRSPIGNVPSALYKPTAIPIPLPDGLRLVPETPLKHADAIETLFDRTFGPGHFAKTAERLREYNVTLPGINRVVVTADNQLVAICRVWPIWVETGGAALFFGPVAVDPSFRGNSLGLVATQAATEEAARRGCKLAILIGHPPYFGRIGFEPAPELFHFPGPQDDQRVLVKPLKQSSETIKDYHGAIRAAPSAINLFSAPGG